MDAKQTAAQAIERSRKALVELSTQIHDHPELAFHEQQASEWVATALADARYDVERGVGGIATALKATFGSGSLHVGICAEYDALPQIGHACGHNLIAAAAVGAAIGLKDVADALDLTITVFGTPAEEDGAGKTLMLQRGVFDGVHAAMMVHAYAEERDAMGSLAVSQLEVDFYGKPAHAAAHPEDGLSASAALALAQSGVAFLREHLHDSDRVHGIVTFGGDAPNVVPDHTHGRWYVRATSLKRLQELEPRIIDVFRGAALMTGCHMKVSKTSPTYTEIRTHLRMAELWRENAAALGRTSEPLKPTDPKASTDMGNVSYAMPTIHPLIKLDASGANIHQREFADAANTPAAHDTMIYGAMNMACTIIDMAQDDALRAELIAAPYVVADETDRSYLDETWQDEVSFNHADI